MIIYLAIILALVLCVITFIKSRRIVNVLVINAGIFILLDCIGNLLFSNYTGDSIINDGFSIVLLINIVYLASFTLGYLRSVGRSDRVHMLFMDENFRGTVLMKLYLAITITSALLMLFLLVYLSGASLFTRELYENTRSYFGPLYFGIQAICTVNIAVSLFYYKSIMRFVIILINLIILASLGSKGIIVFGLFILLTPIFVTKYRGWVSVSGLLLIMSLFFSASFYFFYYYTTWAQQDMLLGMSAYLDGTRNFALLIEKWNSFTFGQLTIEDNIYMLVPRYIFQSKPAIFGSGTLSDEFFKFIVIDKGAPTFTRFGRIWADFGYFSLIISAFIGYAWGRLGGAAEDKLEHNPGIKSLIVYSLSVSQAFLNPGGIIFIVALMNYVLACFVIFLIKPKLANFL